MVKKSSTLFSTPGTMSKKLFLLISLVIIYYIISAFASIYVDGPLTTGVGGDFRAFWSAGKVANTYGYAGVYDLQILEEIQQTIVRSVNEAAFFQVVPVPYFAIFFPLFQTFALIPPIISYIIWTIFTTIGTFFYLIYSLRKWKLPNPEILAMLALMSYPFFTNLFWGQLNILLVVFVGEFIWNAREKRDFRAGLWIGGIAFKPQLLILVGLIFLFQRKWKIMGGFLMSVFVVLVVSLFLVGEGGFNALLDLILNYSVGMPTNAPEYMINWRMMGELLGRFFPPSISWGVTAIGMIAMAVIVLFIWRRRVSFSSPMFLVLFTGTLAATLVVTWHSHTHMGMILIPGIMLLKKEHRFTPGMFYWWQFFIPLFMFFVILPMEIINIPMGDIPELVPGIAMFLFNLFLLGWACNTLRLGILFEDHA